MLPSENVATIKNSALVIEGVSRTRNALINGNTRSYDWDSGYTCHQLGSGAICIQLSQPYLLSSMRLLLWDCDDRSYSFYIEVSIDQQKWVQVADKRREACKSWQTVAFDPIPVTFIRIVGTHNTANEVFHCVHFESPADTSVNNLISSVANVSMSGPVSSATGSSPRQQTNYFHVSDYELVPALSRSSSSSSTQSESQPTASQSHNNYPPFYGPNLPPSPRQQQNRQQQMPEGAQAIPPHLHPQHYQHHQQGVQQARPPPQGLGIGEVLPPVVGQYAGHHALQQQDVPEADRMENQ